MRTISKFIDFRPKFFSCMKDYNKQKFGQDALAGLITGIVALPLAIAFGIASGVSPQEGIITAIVAGFIISLLGGSKVQIGGPTGAFIVIIYGIVKNPEYGMLGLGVATILAGVLLVLMGVFKLGTVIKFIPYPIIIGFTAGIAVTIFTTQMGDVFGLKQSVVDASLRSALSGRKNHPKSVTALERESYYDHKLERSPPSAGHSASLLMMSRIPAAVSRRSNLSYPRLKPNQLLLLFKASIHRYSFIHGDISFSNKERRKPDLNRERIRNAKHFRR